MGGYLSLLGPSEDVPNQGRFNKPPVPTEPETTEDIKDILHVTGVNFNLHDDCKAHHTWKFTKEQVDKCCTIIVRRGQPFQIILNCDQPFDQEHHELKLIFETGDNPLPTKGTQVELILSDVDQEAQWGAKILEQKDMTLTLEVITPPCCIIGRWSLKVRTLKKANLQPSHNSFNFPQPIYILFNPWCKADQVYLHDDGLLQEYVLNDTGKIFKGDKKNIYGKPWNFGQFADPVLDCVLDLLNKLRVSDRGDPVKVVRTLSALVNSSDENGILLGNWSGHYKGGKSPNSWTGSKAILEEYHRTKSPVKYGQCWVFSGVMTTCCRALGIPTRSVTNFSSAHDTDTSVTIDYHLNAEGEFLDDKNHDSIWNFHVWNDVWMARPDRKDQDYGGWQACDATPQEASDGLYCCGPCPLMAIKNGDITMNYDGSFIFSEVNADVVYWQVEEGKPLKKLKVKTESVGKYISTFKPQCLVEKDTFSYANLLSPCIDKRWQDITSEYKYDEGWGAERAAVMMANMTGTRKRLYDQPVEESQDVVVKVVDKKQVNYGDDFEVEFEFENKSKEDRTVSGNWSLGSFFSTGVFAYKIVSKKLQVKLSSEKKETKKMKITFGEYDHKTVEGCYFKASIVCSIQETKQTAMDEDNFRLIKPDLQLKSPSEVKVGSTFRVEISFDNPLSKNLTDCWLEIEGPGLQNPLTNRQSPVQAKQTYNFVMDFTATKPGTRTIIANFDSKELVDISGSCEIEVKDE
ncbi:hemocyte protein-glutamine gamma-glutamyltransferase-like [Ylistrum balloti]|uniref:hemocyte protein-glutamine gamma-glutamyltransferase-like n=1 Tax=Ylistrum balloti TaxID=509963 RepID=UPI00290590E2|nr:hemocyte protein-glutamine gamma-glutamyltransferase-like [Ylistrum balloti]